MPLPKQARRTYQGNNGYERLNGRAYPQRVTPTRHPNQRPTQVKRQKKVKKKLNFMRFLSKMISFTILILIGIFILPFGFNRISKPLLFGPSYQEVKVDYNELYTPTANYLSNDLFLNTRLLTAANTQNPQMSGLYTTDKMPVLESKLTKLMSQYKTIDPSIFVWDYDSGKYVDIKATNIYSAASIIKIPVLIQLFKSIEANQLTIYDEMALTDFYRAEGSGGLQYNATGAKYSIDQLARLMITRSDNSATNMLMSAIGAMPDVNSGIRSWGLKNTSVNNWLPDMVGSNYTTAKDLATMLYNLDNPGFLNLNSREYIIDYMSHVENNRLIQAGLDPKALFIHKTGDIGKTLGDAGIVFAPNGKKYIVAILANRPYNSPRGKNFIQKASKIIYDSMIVGGH